jgi:hypothetical protein
MPKTSKLLPCILSLYLAAHLPDQLLAFFREHCKLLQYSLLCS